VLVTWAQQRGPGMMAAIDALGDVVSAKARPREETFVALLELAAGNASRKPVPAALYPLGRTHLPSSVMDSAREVATARLRDKGPARLFAVRTLGRSGVEAVPQLQKVATDVAGYTPAERAEAVRALGKLGRPGQRALHQVLPVLTPVTDDPLTATSLVGPDFGVLLLALKLVTEVGRARKPLRALSRLAIPTDAPKALLRRLSWLRCAAAQVLAERDYTHADLLKCDVTTKQSDDGVFMGSVGARAIVAAIGVDGTRIRGKRHAKWSAYVRRGPLRARQAAVALIATHPEIRDASTVLASALAAPESGLVATAAEAIKKAPQSVYLQGKGKGKGSKNTLDPAVAKALLAQLKANGPAVDLETLGTVIDAVAALRLTEAADLLRGLCASPHQKARRHAAKALSRISGKATACPAPAKGLPRPVELDHLIDRSLTVDFESDAGKLTVVLDGGVAPLAVTRIADLVKAGFFDGMVVHRVVPGFVSQLGSPTADGYGGAPDRPAMACETSPIRFDALSVGIALAGRDTGSSQFFVTHTPYPHLDGRYAWIGRASGSWASLVDGDRIVKASLRK